MKIENPSFALALALFLPGCTDDVEPPVTIEDASTTDADGSTGGNTDTPDTSESGTGSETEDEDEDSSSTGMPSTGEVEFFSGVSDNFTPEGMPTVSDRILARRQMVPEDSLVLETLYLIAEDDTWQRFDLVQEVDLASQTFTSGFETEFGNLVVEGEYTSGEDWAWDAWRSTSTYVDGFSEGWTVISEDQTLTDGSHEADKQVLDPDGVVFVVIEERLEAIDEATFEDAVAGLR